jgi:hypothetical protein
LPAADGGRGDLEGVAFRVEPVVEEEVVAVALAAFRTTRGKGKGTGSWVDDVPVDSRERGLMIRYKGIASFTKYSLDGHPFTA